MAQTATTTGTVTAQAPLDELTLTLEEAFGTKSIRQEALTLRTLVGMQETSQNFIEAMDQSGDRVVSIIWTDNCDDVVADCEEDLCDAPEEGDMRDMSKQILTIDECWEHKFFVDETMTEQSKVRAQDYIQVELEKGVSNLLKKGNMYSIEALVANIGVNAMDGETKIEFPEATYTEKQGEYLAQLYVAAQQSGMHNPFNLNDGSWILPNLIAELGQADNRFAFMANQLMPTTYDVALRAELAANTHGLVVSPNAYAVAGKNYAPTTVQDWSGNRGGGGKEWFSLPTGIPGLVIDVYVSRICKDAEKNLFVYEYVMRLRMDVFFNPNPCYFGDLQGVDEDIITGIFSYGTDAT